MSDEHPHQVRNVIEPKTYRCQRWYRRMIYYAVGGSVSVLATVAWMGWFVQGRVVVLWPPMFLGLALMSTLWLVGLMGVVWRLSIDRCGITFRRFFRSHFWPWDAFQDGRVELADGLRGFKWGTRVLPLSMLEGEDFDEVYRVCRMHRHAPPLEPLPESVHLSVSMVVPVPVILGERGIIKGVGKNQKDYDWSDVQKLTLVLPERDRDDFYEAAIELPDTQIRLRRDQDSREPRWRGASSTVVARYLKQRVPSNVISIVSLTREPETVDEAEYHLARLRPRTKMVRAYYWTVLVLLTLLWLLGARAEVLYLAFLSLPGLYVVWYRQRQARREESKYLAIREQLLAEANDASPE